MNAKTIIASALVVGGLWAGAAFAEQSLPSDQQKKVESKLQSEGYSKWDEIGMEDKMIKVDNAVDAKGKQFDLQIDPQTMQIKSTVPEEKGSK